MDNQYSYPSNPRERSNHNMIRTIQSPPIGAGGPHGRYEGIGEMQHGGLHRGSMINSNPYIAQHSGSYGQHQLPPLHARDPGHGQQSGPYSQMPPRPAHSPPASGSMGFQSSYMTTPSYAPPQLPQFSSSTSLPHESQPPHYSSVMPYQTYFTNPTSSMTDYRGLTATTQGQSMPDAMAPQYHMSPTSEHEFGPRAPHSVGTQGRRGILPSDEGRPPALATGASKAPITTIIPPKDEHGKFPCPHCNKTYLHAKHLKRHLLRHTGDRPYSCVLCNDTFSRSDILKRHFQKCSIRRGNPNNATHLSNSPSWLKKQAKGGKASSTGTIGTGNPAPDPRPNTSDSGESGGTSQHSAQEVPFDQSNAMGGGIGGSESNPAGGSSMSHNSSLHLQNGSHATSRSAAPPSAGARPPLPTGHYASGAIHVSPATSPSTTRPGQQQHMGFYEAQGYQTQDAYMGS